MKKAVGMVTAWILALSVSLIAFAQEDVQRIRVVYNGQRVIFEQPAYLDNDIAMVPLETMFQVIGAKITWSEDNTQVTVSKRGHTVTFTNGSQQMMVDGQTFLMEEAMQMVDGVAMVPLRAVEEAFGMELSWNEASKTAILESPLDQAITENYIIQEVRDEEEGPVIMEIVAAYPVFRDTTKLETREINEDIKNRAKDFVSQASKELSESALHESYLRQQEGSEVQPFEVNRVYEITYLDDTYVSYLMTDSYDTNGAHANTEKSSVVYNRQTGEAVERDEFFTDTPKELDKKILNGFYALIDQNPGIYFDNAKEYLEQNVSSLPFYLVEDGLVFYLQPYEIAPLTTGYIEMKLEF